MTSSETLLDLMTEEPLRSLARKVVDKERLSRQDGLYLLETAPGEKVRLLADYARQAAVGEVVYYTSTVFIHPTNLCELSCPLCSYYAKPGWKSAWFLSPEEIENQVKRHWLLGATEVHIVGGLWRECNLDYYGDVFRRIKAIDPALHLKALTAVEYDFLAKLHDISLEEVFSRMMSWGLDSLPGGGAEILVESVRRQIAPQKISSQRYLEIHRMAHRLGLPSNVTLLFGHLESNEDIVSHLCQVRELQDETKGFVTFVPLKFHEENNALGKLRKKLKPKEVDRLYAVSRLMLDNIPNLRVLWNYVGVQAAQQILRCGANDLGSTAFEEKISHLTTSPQKEMSEEGLINLIREIGRTPKELHATERRHIPNMTQHGACRRD